MVAHVCFYIPSLDELFESSLPVVSPNSYLQNVLALLKQFGYLLVIKNERLLGIITEKDLIQWTIKGVNWLDLKTQEIMRSDFISLTYQENSDFLEVLSLFKHYNLDFLPVRDEFNNLLGVISYASIIDILPSKFLAEIEHKELENRLLKNINERQNLINFFSKKALEILNIEELFKLATKLIDDIFNIEYISIFELLKNEAALILKNGKGWPENWLKIAKIWADDTRSQAAYTLKINKPVIVTDLLLETRFSETAFLHNQGIISGVTVIIPGGKKNFGVLGIHSKKYRQFSSEEVNFLQNIANILGAAITRINQELQLNLFFNLSLDLFFISDLTAHFIQLNPQFNKILGYQEETLLSQSFLNFVHPQDISLTLKNIKKLAHNIDNLNFQCRYKCEDQSYRWFDWTFIPYEEGFIYGVGRDITENKEIQAKLETSEQLHRLVINNISDAVFITNEKGEFTFICPNVEHIFGYNQKEIDNLKNIENLLGNNIIDFSEISQKIEIKNREIKVLDKFNQEHFILMNVKLVSINGGTILYTCRDISDRRQTELALIRSEEKFRNAVLNAPIPIIIHGENGEILQINKVWTELTGYTPEDIPTIEKWTEKAYGTKKDFIKKGIEKLYQITERVEEGEFIINTKQNTQRIWKFYSSPLGHFNDINTVISMGIDITKQKKIELALRESEAKLRATFEQAAVGITHVSLTGKFINVNKKFCQIVGYSKAELLEKTFKDITFPDDLELDIKYVSLMLNNEIENYSLEKRYIRKNGDLIWINLTVSLVKDTQHQPKYFISVIEDISQRKKIEEQLRKSLKSLSDFKYAIDQSAIVLITNNQGIITYINEQFCKISQYQKQELIGQPHKFINSNYHPKSYFERLWTTISSGKIWRGEIKNIRKNGDYYWVDTTIIPFVGEDGRPWQYLAISYDITDRKKAEDKITKFNQELEFKVLERTLELEAAENKFKSFVENVNGIIYTLSSDGQLLTYLSPQFSEILGYEVSQFINKNWYSLIHPDDLEETKKVVKKCISEEISCSNIEYRIKHKCGDWCWHSSNIAPIINNNKLSQIVGVAMDITESKKTALVIQENQHFIEKITESNPNILYIYDLEKEYNIYTNKEIFRILGYTPMDIYSMKDHINNIFHPDEILKIQEHHEKCINMGDDQVLEIEYRVKDHDNNWHWFLSRDTPFDRDKNGKVRQILGGAADITTRKQMEEKLKNSLEEKELLLKEIHHRVKNNLLVVANILEFQTDYIEDSSLIKVLEDSQNRIYSMALIHEKLYRSTSLHNINFADYLEALVTNLFDSYNTEQCKIELELDLNPIFLNIETANPCALIVNELISNALKHGFKEQKKGRLILKLFQNNNQEITLIVQDNGRGFPDNMDYHQVESLGMELVCTLTKQIKGNLELIRDNGTIWKLTFSERMYKQRF